MRKIAVILLLCLVPLVWGVLLKPLYDEIKMSNCKTILKTFDYGYVVGFYKANYKKHYDKVKKILEETYEIKIDDNAGSNDFIPVPSE